MNNSDLILHLFEQLIQEKEKNIMLEHKQKQLEQITDEKMIKTDM